MNINFAGSRKFARLLGKQGRALRHRGTAARAAAIFHTPIIVNVSTT
jgi:hypothetical protein